MNKKLITLLLGGSLLASTSTNAVLDGINKDPAYIATVGAGLIMTGGGVYWLVKNPKNKKEGAFKRTVRTVCALGLTAGGIGLILGSKQLHAKMATHDFSAMFSYLGAEAGNLFDQGRSWVQGLFG